MRGWWSRISQLAVFIVMGAMIVSIGLDTAWKSLMPVRPAPAQALLSP
jgi:hypothetical protein